ncbi:MAG: 4Fe-4S dicluster domain-containing protein [Acidobacteriota bacterium]
MPRSLSRKELLHGLLSFVREAGERTLGEAGPDPARLLRPPGALLPDSAYLDACTGCEKCVAVCPPGAIFMADVQHRDEPRRVAVVLAAREPCRVCTEVPCAAACPEPALAGPLSPRQVRIGVAQVNPTLCRPFRGEECDLCVRFCPFPGEAIRLIGTKPVVIPEACTGCGMCEAACPERPRAIRVVPERDLIPGVRLPKILPWRR